MYGICRLSFSSIVDRLRDRIEEVARGSATAFSSAVQKELQVVETIFSAQLYLLEKLLTGQSTRWMLSRHYVSSLIS